MTGPVVETDLGFVRGTVREGISSFRGIPFASAPEGPPFWRPAAEARAYPRARRGSRGATHLGRVRRAAAGGGRGGAGRAAGGPAGRIQRVRPGFIFGNPGNRYAARLLGTPPPPGFGDLSREMRSAWVSFAATGDPGWRRFDAAGRRTRLGDTPPADTAYPLPDLYRLWPH